MNKKISKILIANRGEIAVRIIRAARDLGIKSVAVCSEADQGSLAVRLADERYLLEGSSATQTYLNQDKLILAAIEMGANAMHPGYGFLSENDEFAKKVEDNNLIFIGPSSDAIYKMGDKLRARELAIKAKVPVLPGLEFKGDKKEIIKFIDQIKYPIIIKASAGGSGRGIRICKEEKELFDKLEEASKEAKSAFGSEVVYVEKYLETPRHIEVQIVSDNFGNHHHLFERDCSVQRRRQKLVEEAVAPKLNEKLRNEIREAAVNLAKLVGYNSVGTMEFLVDDKEDRFYFLEMNTRLQVEHTVTEEVANIDLAKLQIQIADGLNTQNVFKDVKHHQHSIQFRLYAEDPYENFQPSMGTVSYVHLPSGPGVRVDTWCEEGAVVSPYYDALLAKIIVTGNTREEAIARSKRAFYETRIEGVRTNIDFFKWILDESDFVNSKVHINWLEESWKGQLPKTNSLFVGRV